MAISESFDAALSTISERLSLTKVRWVIIGSTSLALQGVSVQPNDIDILTDKSGALKINRKLKDYQFRPVRFSRTTSFESYFGSFVIGGVTVEVMGDLRIKYGGLWVALSGRLDCPVVVERNTMRLPVAPIAEQLASYEKLGRLTDARKVEEIRRKFPNVN